MTQTTLDFIHQSYQEALEKSSNIIQIVENLYDILRDAEVVDEDSKAYDAFIDGLRNCLRMRKMTSDITDIVTYITITIMHIIKWLNNTQQIDIDLNLHGRRKALESDLTKLLRKSNKTLSAKIRDRFGLRGTLLNEPEELAIKYIYIIYDALVGILAAKNRKMRKDFIDWIENSNYVNPVNKALITSVLDIPFDIEEDSYKDYILNKKPNGYQSLHFTLTVQPYSHVIPGTPLEIQLRSKNMDKNASSGPASHETYKKYLDENAEPTEANEQEDVELSTESVQVDTESSEATPQEDAESSEESTHEDNPLLEVFVVDDFSKLHITGFTSYNSREDDEDGIHFSKEFANRRISHTLAPLVNL